MANYIVLLIDYEPRSIERFRDPLVGAGYTVEVATDGVSGVEAFHRLNPDMVLVEAMIPKKHGFEVCQELKRTPHGRRTPVLITTGVYKGRKYRTQALHIYGCDEYIEKPIAPEQLLEIVGRFLGPGSSGPSGSSKDSESSDSPEGPGGKQASKPANVMPSAPRAVSQTTAHTRPVAVPRAVLTDQTEDEIMARLDAILPGDAISPQLAGYAPPAVMTARDVAAEPLQDSPSFDPIPEVDPEHDPFAEMRAEIDAELGQFSAALALELSPSLEPAVDPFPSDQQSSPSVLEIIPLPESDAPPTSEDPATSSAPDEKPGQLVSFDTKRSRKNKKKAQKAIPSRSQQTAAIVVTPTPLPPMPESKPAVTTRSRPAASHEPAGAKRRGATGWVWAGVGLLAVGATYMAISWKGSTTAEPLADLPAAVHTASSNTAPVSEAAPEPAAPASAAPLPEPAPAPVAIAPPPQVQPASEATGTNLDPKKTAAKPVKAPVVNTKKTTESAAVAAEAAIVPPPKSKAKSVDRPKPAPQTAPARLDTDESVAGVETLPSAPPPTPVETIAPGTLVSIDETDAWPVSLKRTLPTYPMAARQLGLAGTVVMNVLVNDRGSVDQVVLVSGIAGGDLNEAAMRAVKTWTYRPATKQGVPVKVWTSEQISFKR